MWQVVSASNNGNNLPCLHCKYNTDMPILTPTQTYAYARAAGFPSDTARKMVAIAQRESSLNTGVVGTINKEKEVSYGLWQINLKDAGIARLMAAQGITAANISDPAVNARAAYLLWGGNDNNLNTAWYINRLGDRYQYGEKYAANLANLPSTAVLEAVYAGGATTSPGGSGGTVVAGNYKPVEPSRPLTGTPLPTQPQVEEALVDGTDDGGDDTQVGAAPPTTQYSSSTNALHAVNDYLTGLYTPNSNPTGNQDQTASMLPAGLSELPTWVWVVGGAVVVWVGFKWLGDGD